MTDNNFDHKLEENVYDDTVTDAEFVEPDTTLGDEAKLGDEPKLGEDVDKAERPTADQVGENLRKIAGDAAFAAVGFAGLVGEKARAFYEDQKRQYAETHPEADRDPGAKDFLAQLREKVERFVEDLTKGYHDMAERGRAKAEKSEGFESPTTETVEDVESVDVTEADKTNYPE